MKIRFSLALGLLAAAMSAGAQQADVTFFVIGKHGSYVQDCSGSVQPVDYSFFAEIFLTQGGNLSDAFLTLPSGERVAFEDRRKLDGAERDNLFLVTGSRRFESHEALQAAYPDGAYRIEFATPGGRIERGDLEFPGGGLPQPPKIGLSAGGSCQALDPDRDLTVTWSPFTRGRADPRGILDDLIFVILTDAEGVRVAHSGRPFEDRPYLSYADLSFTIPAEALSPGRKYTLSVEHAVLADTREYDSVPAMTTYAATTRVEIETADTLVSGEAPLRPSIESQTVMLYYPDLGPPAAFYGQALGLEQTLDLNWVKFFKTSPTSTVGLVLEGEGYHPARPENSVMLSLVTREIDVWYRRLKGEPGVVFLKEMQDDELVRSFLIADPGGYTVEFYQWQQP